MKTNRISKDILTFENFLSKEECISIINFLDEQEKNQKMSWVPISFYESYSSTLPENDDNLLKFNLPSDFFAILENRMKNSVAEIHGIDKESVFKIGFHTQKWEPGAYARAHSDNTDEHGNFGAFERSRYASFLYLNDDFDGGILRFVGQDIEIKPETGLLASFSGGFENMHEVTLLTKGVRYTIGSFWDDRDESAYSEELKESWKKEMEKVREQQQAEKEVWQNLLKQGYKISQDGKRYKIEEDELNESYKTS